MAYYQRQGVNPVLIEVERPEVWHVHRRRRENLYQNHLGIPLRTLRGRSVLEFGCNSGENALVLATLGAELTLVEPNVNVLPRLEQVYERFGMRDRVVAVVPQGIQEYDGDGRHDLVVAEGFLHTLPDRDLMLHKMARLLAPGGMGVVSFADRIGAFLEMLRGVLLKRACELDGITDLHGRACREIARRLYADDFEAPGLARPCDAWWLDNLVNPTLRWERLWGYREILPVLQAAGCAFRGSSPPWAVPDPLGWFKRVPDTASRHRDVLEQWAFMFPSFITGRPLPPDRRRRVSPEALSSFEELVRAMSDYAADVPGVLLRLRYPEPFARTLEEEGDATTGSLSHELRDVFDVLVSGKSRLELEETYAKLSTLRSSWGTLHHYVSFIKEGG